MGMYIPDAVIVGVALGAIILLSCICVDYRTELKQTRDEKEFWIMKANKYMDLYVEYRLELIHKENETHRGKDNE